jgi:hypothetical protein
MASSEAVAPAKQEDHAPRKPFVKRHRRWFTFVGALLVFMTFIVKDGFGEYLKALIESIDSAEGIFAVEKENANLTRKADNLYRSEQMNNDILIHPGRTNEEAMKVTDTAIFLHLSDAIYTEFRLNDEIGAVNRMLQRVPHTKSDEDKAKALQTHLNSIHDEIASADKVSRNNGLDAAFNAAYAVEHNAWGLEDETLKFADTTIQNAIAVRERDTLYFQRLKISSYVLYVIGWSLGLMGRLYGVETGAGG